MTKFSAANSAYEAVVAHVAGTLSKYGFVRKASVLRAQGTEAVLLIDFQRSDKSTAAGVRFTLNLGIVLKKLYEGDVAKVGIVDTHLRTRVGMLSPAKRETWWLISSDLQVPSIAADIEDSLERYAIPYLREHGCEDGLRRLWMSGRSPGLTALQRDRLLGALLN